MNVTLLSEPKFLCPLNAPVWFNCSADWATVQNFKYIYNVRQINDGATTVLDDLGTYRVPPSPTGTSYFSPNKILRTKFTYSLVTSLGGYAYDTQYKVKYNVKYGFESDLVLNYFDEYFDGGFVGLTFSFPHNLLVNQQIEVSTNGTLNPTYNTAATVSSVPNPYYIVTDIPWGLSGPVLGGDVRILYYDAIQYVSSQGTLGIDFNCPHFFLVGDVITIDKRDKSINIEYDGTASVVATTSTRVALNKEFGVTSSVVGDNGGYISRMQRTVGTSSTVYGYNGTRQYNEPNRDFGLSFSVSSGTITSDGLTAARFLTTYEGWKEVPVGYSETAQMFINTSSLIRYKIRTYNANFVLVSGAEITYTYTNPGVYTFGTGPADVLTIFGASILNGATYYKVYLDTISDS